MELMDFQEPTERNNRIVQFALREVDATLLAKAALQMSQEERGIILRNVSERASKLFTEEISAVEAETPRHIAAKAKETFVQKLHKYRDYDDPGDATGSEPPHFSTTTLAEVRRSLIELVEFARRNGALAVESVRPDTDDPIARKGLQFVVDGWDPLDARQILERHKETQLELERRRLDMLINGFDAILSEQPVYLLRERLSAFLPSESGDE